MWLTVNINSSSSLCVGRNVGPRGLLKTFNMSLPHDRDHCGVSAICPPRDPCRAPPTQCGSTLTSGLILLDKRESLSLQSCRQGECEPVPTAEIVARPGSVMHGLGHSILLKGDTKGADVHVLESLHHECAVAHFKVGYGRRKSCVTGHPQCRGSDTDM